MRDMRTHVAATLQAQAHIAPSLCTSSHCYPRSLTTPRCASLSACVLFASACPAPCTDPPAPAPVTPQEQDPDIISQDMLRKYITYAKQTCRPKLGATGYDKLAQVYAQLRQESVTTQGMPIAVRHLESMIRIAEAFALMHLRDTGEGRAAQHEASRV